MKQQQLPPKQQKKISHHNSYRNHRMSEKKSRQVITTNKAPEAIGTYSQAVKTGSTVYLSGQIPLIPETMEIISDDISDQINQVFKNLSAVAAAADGSLDDIVKLNVFLTDLSHFPTVNEIMATYFNQPYPARAAIGVAALPKGAAVEMDAILELG
jgi:reactive intermediate/imine deaminase